MKKTSALSLILAVILLAGVVLPSCGKEEPARTLPETAVTATEEEETLEYLPHRLRRAEVEAFPIVTEDMPIGERRQLAIDFFQMQLTFQWKPNMEVKDYFKTYGNGRKTISTNNVYGGVPYQSKGTGSLYRWLEYYDEETGVMDLERAFAENGGYGEGAAMIDEEYRGGYLYKKYRSFMTFFNQCSWGSFWGWGRTVNSANFSGTAYMNLTNGFIPLGYTYPNMDKIDCFGVETENNPTKYDTKDVIADWNAANGEDGMFKCYAAAQPADLLVSGSHTMMVRQVQLKKLPDGSIDYKNSVIVCLEQPESWQKEQYLSDGTPLIYQGVWELPYTFETLQKQTYIPFTFAEFLDPSQEGDKELLDLYTTYAVAPLEKRYKLFSFTREELQAMSGAGVEEAKIFTNLPEGCKELTFAQLDEMILGSNYTVSDVFVTVKDQNGKVLKENVYRAMLASQREMSMKDNNSTWKKDADGNYLTMTEGIKELATGENTVKICVQLSNGEKPTVFSGKLMP